MATCKWCGKKGLFLTTNVYGLCKNCSFIILSNKQSDDRAINDSLRLIEKTKNVETLISRYNFIIKKLEDYLPLYRHGINLYGKDLIDSIQEVKYAKNQSILELLQNDKEMVLNKIQSLKTDSSKRKNVEKFNSSLISVIPELDKSADNFNNIKTNIGKLKIS